MDAAVVYADMKFPGASSNRSNLRSIQQPEDPESSAEEQIRTNSKLEPSAKIPPCNSEASEICFGSNINKISYLQVATYLDIPYHHQPCPRWHWVALWVGWAGNIILVAAVIAMGVLVMNTNSHHPAKPIKEATSFPDTHQGMKDASTLEDFRSYLKRRLCENTSTERGNCSLCPMTWKLHKDKCYWFSTIIQSWEKSKKDCITKKSQLAVVIYDQTEKEFIRNNSHPNTWIGLSLAWPEKKWVWVDNSTFDQTLSPSGIYQKNSCGSLTTTGIISEICSTELQWICQKESIVI